MVESSGRYTIPRPQYIKITRKESNSPKPINKRKTSRRPPTIKKGIVPGSVLILLSGKARGRRVVFLKQLSSGLLLVTGPFDTNGVPLRRVNQRYTIGTSTRIELGTLNLDKFTDAYFAKPAAKKLKKGESSGIFVETEADTKNVVADGRKKDQQAIDTVVSAAVQKKDPLLQQYLKSRFSLTHGMVPHELKF